MNLVERDTYVVGLFAKLATQGITGRRAVLEVMRVAGISAIGLPGHDVAKLDTDLGGLQSAVAACVGTTRTKSLNGLNGAIAVGNYTPLAQATATTWQMRALNAGA